jgi:hypothetical protein
MSDPMAPWMAWIWLNKCAVQTVSSSQHPMPSKMLWFNGSNGKTTELPNFKLGFFLPLQQFSLQFPLEWVN